MFSPKFSVFVKFFNGCFFSDLCKFVYKTRQKTVVVLVFKFFNQKLNNFLIHKSV